MSFASRNNKVTHSAFEVNLKDYAGSAIKCADLEPKHIYKVIAVGINPKSRYGASAWAVIERGGFTNLLNLPTHMVDTVKAILESADDVADIKAGLVGCIRTEYTPKNYNRVAYSIDWVDIQ